MSSFIDKEMNRRDMITQGSMVVFGSLLAGTHVYSAGYIGKGIAAFWNYFSGWVGRKTEVAKQAEKKADNAPKTIDDIAETEIEKPEIIQVKANEADEKIIKKETVMESEIKSSSGLSIPEDIPDYLAEAILKERDFSLTTREHVQVELYSPLIKYMSGVCFPKQSRDYASNFVKALVAVESRGDKNACSDIYHARGLGQLRVNRAKSYVEDILESEINLSKISKDVRRLGFDGSYIDREVLEGFNSKHLYNPALNLLLVSWGISKNTKKFKNRLDKVCAEWNAGLTRGIRNNRVTNITETKQYIGRVSTMYAFYNSNI